MTRPWASEPLPPRLWAGRCRGPSPGGRSWGRRPRGPGTSLPHVGLLSWRRPPAGVGGVCAGQPLPHPQQLCLCRASSCTCWGRAPIRRSAVRHHLCGRRKVASVTPPGAPRRHTGPASCGQTRPPARRRCPQAFGWGCWGFSPRSFSSSKSKQSKSCRLRMSPLRRGRAQPLGSGLLRGPRL